GRRAGGAGPAGGRHLGGWVRRGGGGSAGFLWAAPPRPRWVGGCFLSGRAPPRAPPMIRSSYHFSVMSVPAAVFLTLSSRFLGLRSTASRPPLRAPGVMLVMLSMNRCVATSVSFIERSRLIETRNDESFENTVPSTQS